LRLRLVFGKKKCILKMTRYYNEISKYLTLVQFIRLAVNIRTRQNKAIPLQAWTGPEDSRRLTLPDFKTIDT